MRFPPLFLFALLGGLTLAACDASTSTDDASVDLRLRMTDAPFPFDLADSANVVVERVELVHMDDGRTVLYDVPTSFNLLDLRDGVAVTLADTLLLGEDAFDQIRFIVGPDAYVVMLDGTVYDLRTPSGSSSGIKLHLPEIVVDEPGETVDVLIDFNVEDSFVTLGPPNDPNGFLFKPVLRVDTLIVNGSGIAPDDIPEPEDETD